MYKYKVTIRKPCESNKLLRLLGLFERMGLITDRTHDPIRQWDEFTIESELQMHPFTDVGNGITIETI